MHRFDRRLQTALLREDFSQRDLFDFYALNAAGADPRLAHDPEISKRLVDQSWYLWQDLTNSFTTMVAVRFLDDDLADEFGIPRVDFDDPDSDDAAKSVLKQTSLATKAKMLHAVISRGLYNFVSGPTWRGLAAIALKSISANDHRTRTLAIDHMLNAIHHGGHVADYLPQGEWLVTALNYRDNATLPQLLRYCSGDVRNLLNRGGMRGGGEVSSAAMLATSLRRQLRNTPDAEARANETTVTLTIPFVDYGKRIGRHQAGQQFDPVWKATPVGSGIATATVVDEDGRLTVNAQGRRRVITTGTAGSNDWEAAARFTIRTALELASLDAQPSR